MAALQEKDHNAVAHPVTYVPPPAIDWSRVTVSRTDENASIQPAKAAVKPAATTSRKRKANELDDETKAMMFPQGLDYPDDNDYRIQPTDADTCNKVRQKIRKWIDSGAQKVCDFREAIGVSGPAYGRFMSLTGTWDGQYSDTYVESVRFFKKRELLGLPMAVPAAKRPKVAEKKQTESRAGAESPLLDTGDISLPLEEISKVPIYMTCNEVRKGLRALLAKGVTQAALCRALSKQYPEGSGQSVSAANLRYFMGQSGVDGGQGSTVFYAGYCLLEKLRIKASKPKSDFRVRMEKVHGPEGMSTESNSRGITCFDGEMPFVDEYGKLQIMRPNGKLL